jgi:hypothetical protein
MHAHIPLRPAGTGPWGTASFVRTVLAVCALACLGGCSAAPPSAFAGPDPADPSARAPSATYRPVTGDYRSGRPVDPQPWSEQNQGVAPGEKR